MQQLQTVTEFLRSEPVIKSEQRAYQMIREGLLPSVRIGRRILGCHHQEGRPVIQPEPHDRRGLGEGRRER